MKSKKIPGVSFYKGRWKVRIRLKGRRLNLGEFNTKTEATWCRWLKEVQMRFYDAFDRSPAFRYLVCMREIDSDGSPLVKPPVPIG